MRKEYKIYAKRYKNPQVLILIGAPGSGKSTFAKYLLRTEDNWVRLNRDDFRAMQFGGNVMEYSAETQITQMIFSMARELLKAKTNIILDATHCNAKVLQYHIKAFNDLADIQFKVFDTPVETLIDRCKQRENKTGKHIPIGVIKKFAQELDTLLNSNFDLNTRTKASHTAIKYATQNEDLPKAIICDLDGTLALINGRNPYDASQCHQDLLNEPVYKVLDLFEKQGYQIILLSGREDTYMPQTKLFLEKHKVNYHFLYMRNAGDYRKDAVIKKELYQNEIENKFFIEFLLDDRNQVVDMWRKELNLPCFQVNYGNF